jgi:aspartyl-tRNA(Asn)/glutamyl-tRNA(Gln) amidotransferase subunit A
VDVAVSDGGGVAADEAICALGSDTGGSIRQPAAFCGIVGMKPTYGRVSRFGLVAFGSSLDQIGPLTKTVEDNALMLKMIAGHDAQDSTCVDRPVPDYEKSLTKEVKGLRIGLPKEYFIAGLDPDVEKSVRAAVKVLQDLGASVVEVSLPHTRFAIPVYYVVAVAEASSNLARFDGVRYGKRESTTDLLGLYVQTRSKNFGDEVKRRILLGTFALSAGYYDAYYLRAQKVRALIKQDFTEAFKKVDVIVSPTSPTPPFRFGEKTADPLSMYLSDVYTIPANLAGIPALSLPCGFSGGLPIGLQLAANYFEEETLYRAAFAFEQATDYHLKRPAL